MGPAFVPSVCSTEDAPASSALYLVVVEPAHMLRNQDSLSCLELSYTGHLEDRNGEGLVEVDQSVFLRLVVEAVLVHFLWILLRVGL